MVLREENERFLDSIILLQDYHFKYAFCSRSMTESGVIEKNRKKLLQSENCCTIIGDTWAAAPTLHKTRQVLETCVTRKSLELLPKLGVGRPCTRMGRFSPCRAFDVSPCLFNPKYGEIIMISNEPKEDATSITDELTAGQKLQMITEIDQRIEKSENRVLAAIAELKSELRSEINSIRSELKSEIAAVNGRVDSLKTLMIYTFTGIFGVFAAFFAGYSALVVWMLNKLIA